MKSITYVSSILLLTCIACNSTNNTDKVSSMSTNETLTAGQSAVSDNVSKPNIVQVAAGSKDHTTLISAVKAAELVDALSNTGPFTVFAPTNSAFEKLPKGTIPQLLEPEKKMH
ncbi:MAG: fasciclin domain-containing protein [Chitinophagaceae bacterium]